MKIPMSWLSDYTDMTGITPEAYNHAMTMSGSKVEGIENLGDNLLNVVVGKIKDITPHPDADKLVVCQIDVGKEQLQIVTGAPNVKVGQTVPVALNGALLPDGTKIKTGKLRGVESAGMLCSYEELGMSESDFPDAEYGILILDDGLPAGMDIREVFHLDENIVDFEITSNRPDCLSVIGLARETAVTFGRPFAVKTPAVTGCGGDIHDFVTISVEDTEGCLRYCGKVVQNVKIGPSPKWMQERLQACGIRAINNIVDITNYIMLEYGQPMHAFDLRDLEGNTVCVRRAKEGEMLTTLDDVERTLDTSMLMICDGKKPVGVAGVMGGLNSEIKEDTTTILFESATFKAPLVRKTAKKLGLRTESSARYEKGLDAENTEPAILRACQLIEELGCGDVVGGMIDIRGEVEAPNIIPFDAAKINAFLGTDIDKQFMEDTLRALGFIVNKDTVIPPSFRKDVEGFADVAEEILRIYGYDKIPSTLMRGETAHGIKTRSQKLEDKIRDLLCGCGLNEIVTYSFTNPNLFDKLNLAADSPLRTAVTIQNPLGVENSIMRTTAIHSMLETLARNVNYRAESAALYEIATIYLPREEEDLPEERSVVALGMYGNCDFYDLKGVVETLIDGVGVSGVRFTADSENPTFHPGRCASISVGKKEIGVLGQIHPDVCDRYGADREIYIAQINIPDLLIYGKNTKIYHPLPKYPSVNRDLAILVDDKVPAADIEAIIRKKAKNLFAGLRLFDVYKGKQVPEGKKSMAYSLTLQSMDKTLTDAEVTQTVTDILAALEKDAGAVLR
ncbi:MAG: phenylalanine--tRNA ligase subunit beta [Ruminococcaceae bacterium]|nr:phenylalanine--tRNA ligase subunit beta [Oscillospiraceae bacterium]